MQSAGYFTNVISPESAVPQVSANTECVSEKCKTVDTRIMGMVLTTMFKNRKLSTVYNVTQHWGSHTA
jgi:hypothetical protein